MTAAIVSTDQGPVDGKPRPHPKKVPPASPRRRSLVRMDDSAVSAWFVGEITTDLRIHCSISVSGSPPTYNSTTLSRPCPSRDFILLPRGLTIVLIGRTSVFRVSLCQPAVVQGRYHEQHNSDDALNNNRRIVLEVAMRESCIRTHTHTRNVGCGVGEHTKHLSPSP